MIDDLQTVRSLVAAGKTASVPIPQQVMVSPEIAAYLLTMNHSNRKLKPHKVAAYARIMQHREWGLTPEPIIVSSTGRLLNGQHRLSAVVEGQAPTPMTLSFGSPEDVFKHLDRGMMRSTADALGMEEQLVRVTKLVLELASKSMSDMSVEKHAPLVLPGLEAILAGNRTVVKTFSSAPLRTAAILRWAMGDDAQKEHAVMVYQGLLKSNPAHLPPLAQSFVVGVAQGRIRTAQSGSTDRQMMAARGWFVMDYARRHQTKLPKVPKDTTLAEVRAAAAKLLA